MVTKFIPDVKFEDVSNAVATDFVSKAEKLGWKYKTELEDGIKLSYEDFLNNPMRAER